MNKNNGFQISNESNHLINKYTACIISNVKYLNSDIFLFQRQQKFTLISDVIRKRIKTAL